MDDLVTRLCTFSLDDGTDSLNKLLREAAAEIELLRRWLVEMNSEMDFYRVIMDFKNG